MSEIPIRINNIVDVGSFQLRAKSIPGFLTQFSGTEATLVIAEKSELQMLLHRASFFISTRGILKYALIYEAKPPIFMHLSSAFLNIF